ncbi:MAG TPA: Ig-like domain-containing protein, partial [Candidatus Sulfomarinibacteraceae bacterium]|nr:Ig-like domain-containing protein [Candidatus Sulfomarinibacteraceae bacterium]
LALYDVTLQNNLFMNNSANRGAGAFLIMAPPLSNLSLIINNLWVDNSAGEGSALYLGVNVPDFEIGQADVSHNTIARQTLGSASAIVVAKGSAQIRNNIITRHTVGVSGGAEAAVTSDYNLYYQNVIHQAGVPGGANNLDGDPLFVDPAAGDYHLQAGSPAIDSALVLGIGVDRDGVARPQGDGYDRGAYEYVIPNAPPVAAGDVYTTTAGVPLAIAAPGVLANDSDPDGDALTALLDSAPGNGQLVLQPDGAFTYTPGADFAGSDTFSYRAADGDLQSEPATVTVHVVAQEPEPDPEPDPGPGGPSLYLPLLRVR